MPCQLNAILRRLHFVCLLEKKLKDSLEDDYWIEHSVMQPVDAVDVQKINPMKEGKYYKCDDFEMNIIDEVALDKALTVTGKLQTKKLGRQFMRSSTMNTLNNQNFSFQNSF